MPAAPATTALSLAQIGFGISQRRKGKKILEGLERPEYQIPSELLQNMNLAQRLAAEGLPEAQKQEYLQNIDRAAQLSLRGLSDRRAGVAALANVQSQRDLASQRLLAMDATQRLRNQQLAFQARERVASARDRAFQLNRLTPFQERRAEGQALYGAGIQNIFGGAGQIAGQQQADINAAGSLLLGGALPGFGGGGAAAPLGGAPTGPMQIQPTPQPGYPGPYQGSQIAPQYSGQFQQTAPGLPSFFSQIYQ